MKAFPQYSVFGENCMLSIKIMAPSFRLLKNNSLVIDSNKKGRILLEWTPRTADGTSSLTLNQTRGSLLEVDLSNYHFCSLFATGGFTRDNQIRFGLSPEELGLMLDQLPEHPVEFVRRAPKADEYSMSGSVSSDMAEKVLRITPGESGMVSYKIDFEKDGVGGQTPAFAEVALGPLEVVTQLGEHQVMMEIMRYSIPVLTGWSTMLETAMKRSVDEARGMGQGGGYRGGRAGNEDVPF